MAKSRGLGRGLESLMGLSDAPAAPEAPSAPKPDAAAPAPAEPPKPAAPAQPAQRPAPQAAAAQPQAAPAPASAAPVIPDKLPIDELAPNPYQPRRTIDQEQLESLAESIKEHGIIQAILVRPTKTGYQIVAGERRWRAAKIAGLAEVPVRVLKLDDAQVMELALVENIQREDLSPIETALGIQELIFKLSLTHEQAAQKLGMSRAAVTNKLRLLQLPPEIMNMLRSNLLTEGHARTLLSLSDLSKMIEFAMMVPKKNLSVRQLEEMVRQAEAAEKIGASLPRLTAEPSEFQESIDRIHKDLGLTVRVAGSRKNMGVLIKGLKKWQIQMLLEYIEQSVEELFPRE